MVERFLSQVLSLAACIFFNDYALFLDDILHTSSIATNQISVNKLCIYNVVYVEFDPHCKEVKLQGPNYHGLYKMGSSMQNCVFGSSNYVRFHTTLDTCNGMLGHPSYATIKTIL